VPEAQADTALGILARSSVGGTAHLIGRVGSTAAGSVTLRSIIGAERVLDRLSGEQLPRIC
jgi:hydrogenase expression/formation protein HypE